MCKFILSIVARAISAVKSQKIIFIIYFEGFSVVYQGSKGSHLKIEIIIITKQKARDAKIELFLAKNLLKA